MCGFVAYHWIELLSSQEFVVAIAWLMWKWLSPNTMVTIIGDFIDNDNMKYMRYYKKRLHVHIYICTYVHVHNLYRRKTSHFNFNHASIYIKSWVLTFHHQQYSRTLETLPTVAITFILSFLQMPNAKEPQPPAAECRRRVCPAFMFPNSRRAYIMVNPCQ